MTGIVIVNYKNELITIQYVKEYILNISESKKVIIVNNEANEESDKSLQKLLGGEIVKDITKLANEKSDIFIISNPVNSGFAKANNLAGKFISNHFKEIKYILFSNNDIQISDFNILKVLINKMEENPSIGIIGPKVVGLDGKMQSPEPYYSFWDRHIWMFWSSLFYSKNKKTKRFKLDYPQKAGEGIHYKVMGSFFMVRAIDFYNCGMMDSNTFLYAEETILSERMKKINKSVYYLPTVSVIHAHGATIKKHINWRKKRDLLYKSESYYYKEYIGLNSLEKLVGNFTHWFRLLIRK